MKAQTEQILQEIDDYLTKAEWLIEMHTFFWIDPITGYRHHTMTALGIQIDRDVQGSSKQLGKGNIYLVERPVLLLEK